MNRPRRVATLLHRWTGLALAGFLTIVGLTGALLAWNDALERVFAPSLFVLPASSVDRPPLDIFRLREAAERLSGGAVNGVDFTRAHDAAAVFYVQPRPGGPAPANDEIALDPASGHLLGARRNGDLSQGRVNIMPFVYRLHDTLLLGDTGALILGIAALFWTLDCLVGAYLTFPARAKHPRAPSGWLARWKPSWLLRWRAGGFRLLYDLHRAGGLWPWALLAILAWSSVSFNLPQVYRPIMALAGTQAPDPPPASRDPAAAPRIGWEEAYAHARTAMAQLTARDGIVVLDERLLFYDPATHVYEYRVRSNHDPGRTGNTSLRLDGDTGRVSGFSVPTGRAAGDTITTWIGDIHVADVFGWPMKVALSLTGLAIAMLSITGVLLWARKRRAHASRGNRGALAGQRARFRMVSRPDGRDA